MPRQKSASNGTKKQAVLSKFFAIKHNQSKAKTSDVNTVKAESDELPSEQSKKRPATGASLQSNEKKARIENGADAQPEATPSTSGVSVCNSTKEKLKSFASSSLDPPPDKHTRDKDISNEKAKPGTSTEKTNATPSKPPISDAFSKFKNSKFTELKKAGVSNGKGKADAESAEQSVKFNSRSKTKYTPLEEQYIDIKAKHKDTILFVEVGYKYRFFGDDAEIAAKELNIFAHLDHNFQTASIPTHRLYVHVRRLVAKGYKVGVVKQMETAALKAAGDNKSAPFTRELSALYTKATLIGEDVDPVFSGDDVSQGTVPTEEHQGATNHLMCIYEAPQVKGNAATSVAIVSVVPSTGELVYDIFEDGTRRAELEGRIAHLEPAEVLLPISSSEDTQRLVQHMASLSDSGDDRIRVEKLSDDLFQKDVAVTEMEQFFNETSTKSSTGSGIDVLKLDPAVICCLHALISYLKAFRLDRMIAVAGSLSRFSTASSHLQLPACTVRNLELFRNQTDGRDRGSLLWLLSHTTSRFGARLLRQWLAKPLRNKQQIEDRLAAVEELLYPVPACMYRLKMLLTTLPDIEKALTTIVHGKCSTSDFYNACDALLRVEQFVKKEAALISELKSSLLISLLSDISTLLDGVQEWVTGLDKQAAKSGDKTQMFRDDNKHPELAAVKNNISSILAKIHDHRREIRIKIGSPALEYTNVNGVEFLVEIKNSQLKNVPNDWEKIGSTKAVSRFHTPVIVEACKELNQQREQLNITANQCWKKYLQSFEHCYPGYRRAVQHLAAIDCLMSLAHVAKQHGYVRPTLVEDENVIEIEGGKHPIVDCLLGEQEQFVPNDTSLNASERRCMIITGPNMGGKSSYIRQVALICIMAQMGGFVPAQSARLGILDAVYTRMGAEDEVYSGRSTFMVELSEASDIVHQSTDRSLVILDELGRGTSTYDGMAIAYATLRYFITEKRCLCLFVTHYPLLAELESTYPKHVANFHMAFMVHDDKGEEKDEGKECAAVTFLYQLTTGAAGRSYGLNVARLAAIPSEIISTASSKSHMLEEQVTTAREHGSVFQQLMSDDRDANTTALKILSETAAAAQQ